MMADLLFSSLLNLDFSIQRISRTSDGQGGWTISRTTVATEKGRYYPISHLEKNVADSDESWLDSRIFMEPDSNVKRGDLLVSGSLLIDVYVVKEPSKMGHHLEVEGIRRVQENEGS